MNTGVLNTSDGNSIQTERSVVSNTTRDLTTASGTQAVTGLGFKPSTIWFLCAVQTTAALSLGFTGPTLAEGSTWDQDPVSSGTYSGSNSVAIRFEQGGSIQYIGNITSFDTDGFTITWTKIGATTGTGSVRFIAFK